MTSHIAVQAVGSSSTGLFEGGVSWGMVLLFVLGFLVLVLVCSLGFIARLRDRAADRQAQEAKERAAAASPQPDLQDEPFAG
jgi:putative copper export protein